MHRKYTALLVFALLVSVTLTYVNHFHNPFEFDDHNQITDNIFIRDIKNIPLFFKDAKTASALPSHQTYRPIVMSTLAIDYYFGKGLNPFYFHISTFFWFLVQLVLMFFLFRSIFRKATSHPFSDFIAFFAVAWYGLHPANAETINYIYQRGDALSTLCVVAAFYIYIVFPKKRKWLLYLIPAALGIFTKEPAAMFAPILFVFILLFESEQSLYDIFKKEGIQTLKKSLIPTIPAFIICIGLGYFIVKMQASTWVAGGPSKFHYLITQPWVLLHYFISFILPVNLSADTDWVAFNTIFEERVIVGITFILVLLFIAFKTSVKKETKPIAFGILWFLLSLIPTSSFVALAEVTNDHRMFFPFVGLSMSISWAIGLLAIRYKEKLLPYKYVLISLCILILSGYALGARQRNTVWNSEESLWHDVTLKSPKNGRGLMNYGLSQMRKGNYAVALDYFERALVLNPYYATLHINLGIVNNALGKTAQAEDYYKKGILYGADDPTTYKYYAKYLYSKGRIPEAIFNAERSLALCSVDSDSRYLLMDLYRSAGQQQKLNTLIEETKKVSPNDTNLLRFTTVASGPDPIKTAEDAAKKSPTAENYISLSLLYYNSNNYEQCISACKKALKADPNNQFAYNNICSAYNALGKWKEAAEACKKSLEINPNFERAANNLKWAEQHLK